MHNRYFFALLLALVSAIGTGCTKTPYHAFDGSTGYSDTPMRPTVYEVSFAADSELSSTQARWYSTVRASEVTLENGKNFFEILEARDAARMETVHMPGSAMVNTNETRNASGTNRSTWSTVNETPSYTRDYANPISIILIRLQDERSPSTLDVRDILRRARAQGAPLSAATIARLDSGA